MTDRKIVDYIVINVPEDELSECVKGAINEGGYQPFGNPLEGAHVTNMDTKMSYKYIIQPMVKYEESEK